MSEQRPGSGGSGPPAPHQDPFSRHPASAYPPSDYAGGAEPGGTTFLDAVRLVRRRWALILGVALACTALAGYLRLQTPPTYRASAVIRLQDPQRMLTGST